MATRTITALFDDYDAAAGAVDRLAAAGARHAALTNPFKGAPTSAALGCVKDCGQSSVIFDVSGRPG